MTAAEYQKTIIVYNDYLNKMQNALKNLCNDLEENNFTQMSPVMTAIIDGLDWINEALESFLLLKKISQEQYYFFKDQLTAMAEALDNQDYTLLHDILEFELIPLLEDLRIDESTLTV